jgi:hypothetical protein
LDGETLRAEMRLAQTTNPLTLLLTVVLCCFYIDFYSGVLHVALDNPRFVRLPLIGVPCVEFHWHRSFPYDISTRRLLDVWGDLNVLLAPGVHHVHHNDHELSFPALNGHSRGLIQAMLRVVPNAYAWLALFVVLTAFDLVAVGWMIERIWGWRATDSVTR